MPVLSPEVAPFSPRSLDRLDRRGTALLSSNGPGSSAGNYMAIGRKKAQWTAGTAEKEISPSEGPKFGRLSGDTEGANGPRFTSPHTRGNGGPGGPGGPGVANDKESLTEVLDRPRDRFANEAVQAINQQANQQVRWEDLPVPVQEVLGLPVRQLADLPIPSTISLRLDGPHPGTSTPNLPSFTRPVVVTASLRRYRTLVADGVCTFAPAELVALTAALESGRALPEDVVGWCRKKLEIPGGWKLGVETALGGGRAVGGRTRGGGGATLESVGLPTAGEHRAHGWTLGRLLEELGGRVVAVEIEREDQSTETLWAEGREERASANPDGGSTQIHENREGFGPKSPRPMGYTGPSGGYVR